LLLVLVSAVLVVAGGASAWRWAGARSTAAAPATSAPGGVPSLPPTGTHLAPIAGAARRSVTGVPVRVQIPVASAHHPHGVSAPVTGHRLNPDGSLFVPADPRAVAWSSDDAAPGSQRGTTILVSHVNYVVDGRTVAGAFADLAEYARSAIGRPVLLRLADGRTLRYRIVRGVEYPKATLAARPGLRRTLFDQTSTFGRGTGRLLLVSCGGSFDPITGEYEDNVFLYALPVG
jgi:hypothetical protein